GAPPDLDDPALLAGLFAAVQELREEHRALAYHDRSDGGLLVTLLEMAFAGGVGLDVDVAPLGADPVAALFAEELGAVVQVHSSQRTLVLDVLGRHGLAAHAHRVGRVLPGRDRITIRRGDTVLLDEARSFLRGVWSETTHAMQRLRDDPASADEEQAGRTD